jgi:hypothetical protein
VTRREFTIWAAVGGYVALFTAAVVWAQWWTIRQPKPFVAINVEAWLSASPTEDGPRIDTFAGPPTAAGLEKAVREQWAIVSTLDHLGRSLWGSYECSLVIFEDGMDRSDLEMYEVHIEMTGPASADVVTGLKPRDGRRIVFWKAPARERWAFHDGAWVNTTCSYYDGPSPVDLIIDGTIDIRLGSHKHEVIGDGE